MTACLVFCNLGCAYATSRAAVGVHSSGVIKPQALFKMLIPIAMAGILGLYGLVISFVSMMKIDSLMQKGKEEMTYGQGYRMLAAGLQCGLSSLAAGLCMGIVGDTGVRAFAQ